MFVINFRLQIDQITYFSKNSKVFPFQSIPHNQITSLYLYLKANFKNLNSIELNIFLFFIRSHPTVGSQDAIHITAILGESVIFNCHVEFPGDHPVPYVLQWEKKVSETVRHLNLFSALLIRFISLLFQVFFFFICIRTFEQNSKKNIQIPRINLFVHMHTTHEH